MIEPLASTVAWQVGDERRKKREREKKEEREGIALCERQEKKEERERALLPCTVCHLVKRVLCTCSEVSKWLYFIMCLVVRE